MANPKIGLTALTLLNPALPDGVTTLSVDSSILKLQVAADLNTIAVDIVVGSELVTLTNPTVVNGTNQFPGLLPIATSIAPLVCQLTGRNFTPGDQTDPNVNNPLLTPTYEFELLYLETQLAVAIGPPSGITIYKSQSNCQVEWSIPPYPGFQGVRVQWSTDPSGVAVPYRQYGGIYNDVTRSTTIAVAPPTVTTASVATTDPTGTQNETRVTETSVTTMAEVSFSSVTIPQSAVNADIFYVLLTVLIQDPGTNQVYESQAAGPFTCGYVNLKKVNPTDFLALQQNTDIASRMMSEITRRETQLDLTARSEIRDLIINPLALELANASVREWFSHCCQAISAISQIDNASGSGISDPVQTSSVKQQIARAYGLNATDVQTYIDSRFDVLGEAAGISRGGATTAVVPLTFFVFNLPTALISVPAGVVVSTKATGTKAAVSFVTTGSGVIDPSNANAFYDATNGWYSVTIPGQCQQVGSIGQVGAGAISQVMSGGSAGVAVINLLGSQNGTDRQSNADYAAVIQATQETGKDTSSTNGYLRTALGIPGITAATVVGAGNVDMLRDWSEIEQKHIYGCVDVYARGNTASQQSELVPFSYASTSTYGQYGTYLSLTPINIQNLLFKILGFPQLPFPLYTAVELVVRNGSDSIYLGVSTAQFDNVNGNMVLNPTENAYQVNADGSTSVYQLNGADATNAQIVQAIGISSATTYALMARYQSGLEHIPALQPVQSINSVTGPITGLIDPASVQLIRKNDFLLTGGSNDAGDTILVSPTVTGLATKTLTLATTSTTIASGMAIPVNSLGQPQNVLSVRSADLSTLYEYGLDYTITATGRYATYALTVLNDATTNQPRITSGASVVVAYNSYILNEQIALQTDNVTLSSSTAVPLSQAGFIHNSWLPVTYGDTTLMLDGWVGEGQAATGLVGAGIAPAARYIKVTFNNGSGPAIMVEGHDFTLTVNPATGAATVARVIGGSIPDGGSVSVTYFYNEVFTIASEYPTFVQQLISAIDVTRDASASVLVKAMVASPIDLTLQIRLDSATTPDAVDGTIRTVLQIAADNADGMLYQAKASQQVMAIPGVVNVSSPFLKCAKSDGSYDIGYVIPTSTPWLALNTDTAFLNLIVPAQSFITTQPVLQNATIPGGGTADAYVGLLYEGQSFRRATSIQDFLTNSSSPSFYIIGTGDQISPTLSLPSAYAGKILITIPATVANPGLQAYRVTYQVFGESGARDISTSSSEYLSIGNINLLYSSAN